MKSMTQWSAFYFTNKEIHISIHNAKIPITASKNEWWKENDYVQMCVFKLPKCPAKRFTTENYYGMAGTFPGWYQK